MKMMITIQKEIPRDIVENVFITALEGGSNYWYWLTEDTVKRVRRFVSKEDEPALSAAIFKAVVNSFVVVQVHDKESLDEDGEPTELLGEINAYEMQERLQKLANDPVYSYALEQELNETGDAATSDIVFQFLVMGECIFS
jgi:hypothetical protein